MSNPPIVYRPREDATPEAELSVLSACYAFILQKHQERKKATRPGGSDDAMMRQMEGVSHVDQRPD
jgi:hypothetical protein